MGDQHEHPLILTMEVEDEFVCSKCQKALSAPIFRCSEKCEFYLHQSCCVKPPQQIRSFFHPCPLVHKIDITESEAVCFGCWKGIYSWHSESIYRCNDCHFQMHIECALVPKIKSGESQLIIQHFTHIHPLTLVDLKEKRGQVCCSVCGNQCSDISAYSCDDKNCSDGFFLHVSCMASIPPKIDRHPFHSRLCPRPLVFSRAPLRWFSCFGCGTSSNKYSEHFIFSCGKYGHELHLKCALLPTIETEGAHLIQHFSHRHPLALLDNQFGKTCNCCACGSSCGFSPSFCCSKCEFFLHKECAKLPENIHHHSHPLHHLTLSFPYRFSSHSSIDGSLITYRCIKCDFKLDNDRAMFTSSASFNYGGYLHLLLFFEQSYSHIYCNICHRKATTSFLRCMVCGLNLHLYCHPSTPSIINHKSHLHPLTLTKSPFHFELNSPEDAENSDDEFYCDVCEEKREKREQVYYCAECKFIAESRCVLSELLPVFFASGDATAINGRFVSKHEENFATHPTVAELNNEIDELGAKAKVLRKERDLLKVEIEPLKLRIGQLEARLQGVEAQLNPTIERIDNLQAERSLVLYQPKYNLKAPHN